LELELIRRTIDVEPKLNTVMDEGKLDEVNRELRLNDIVVTVVSQLNEYM